MTTVGSVAFKVFGQVPDKGAMITELLQQVKRIETMGPRDLQVLKSNMQSVVTFIEDRAKSTAGIGDRETQFLAIAKATVGRIDSKLGKTSATKNGWSPGTAEVRQKVAKAITNATGIIDKVQTAVDDGLLTAQSASLVTTGAGIAATLTGVAAPVGLVVIADGLAVQGISRVASGVSAVVDLGQAAADLSYGNTAAAVTQLLEGAGHGADTILGAKMGKVAVDGLAKGVKYVVNSPFAQSALALADDAAKLAIAEFKNLAAKLGPEINEGIEFIGEVSDQVRREIGQAQSLVSKKLGAMRPFELREHETSLTKRLKDLEGGKNYYQNPLNNKVAETQNLPGNNFVADAAKKVTAQFDGALETVKKAIAETRHAITQGVTDATQKYLAPLQSARELAAKPIQDLSPKELEDHVVALRGELTKVSGLPNQAAQNDTLWNAAGDPIQNIRSTTSVVAKELNSAVHQAEEQIKTATNLATAKAEKAAQHAASVNNRIFQIVSEGGQNVCKDFAEAASQVGGLRHRTELLGAEEAKNEINKVRTFLSVYKQRSEKKLSDLDASATTAEAKAELQSAKARLDNIHSNAELELSNIEANFNPRPQTATSVAEKVKPGKITNRSQAEALWNRMTPQAKDAMQAAKDQRSPGGYGGPAGWMDLIDK